MRVRKAIADALRQALRAAGFRSVTRIVRGGPLRIPLAMGELRSLLFDVGVTVTFSMTGASRSLTVSRLSPAFSVAFASDGEKPG